MIRSGILAVIIMMVISSLANAQTLTINITKWPASTTGDTTFYLAGDLNNWNPQDDQFKFEKNTDGIYALTIKQPLKELHFKITRGSWQTVEADANGNAIPNRDWYGEPSGILNIEIQGWEKQVVKRHTALPNVKILSENFSIPQLKTSRKIWIYLPPDYETSNKKYPVIYMHDGQNLFDDYTSFSGEWAVDETLNQIFAETGKSAIVVGIDNGGPERLNEYSPWNNSKYKTTGKGDLYVDFLIKTLKPYIDKTYRTQKQASKTAILGSSVGGLISLYAGVKYPQVFGKAGIFSPAFWFASDDLKKYLNQNHQSLKKSKFYIVAGKNEDESMVPEINDVDAELIRKKMPEDQIKIKIDEDGTHSETYWRRELKQAIILLLQ